MSQVATTWAVTVRGISASEARVLWHLADCHNPVRGCFPSQQYLAENSEMDIRSVRRQLANLRDKGLIRWDESREANRQGSNRYQLAFEPDFQPGNLSASESGSGGQDEHLQADNSDGFSRTPESAEPVIEPVREPERERARDAGKGRAAEQLLTLKRMHPASAQEDPEHVAALWSTLTAAERDAAVARHPDWLEDGRKAKRTVVPKLAFYLGKKLWNELPPRAPGAKAGPVGERAWLGPFDRAWWRFAVFDAIARDRATLADRDSAAARSLQRTFSLAASRLGVPVARDTLAQIEEAALRMVKVHVDGADWGAWRSAIYQRFYFHLPTPDAAEWVWVPTRDPGEWADQAGSILPSIEDDAA